MALALALAMAMAMATDNNGGLMSKNLTVKERMEALLAGKTLVCEGRRYRMSKSGQIELQGMQGSFYFEQFTQSPIANSLSCNAVLVTLAEPEEKSDLEASYANRPKPILVQTYDPKDADRVGRVDWERFDIWHRAHDAILIHQIKSEVAEALENRCIGLMEKQPILVEDVYLLIKALREK